MLKIRQLQLKVILDREDNNKLVTDLCEKYELLLHGMKKDYLKRLGLKIEDADEWILDNLAHTESHLIGGDIVYIEPETIMYYKIPYEKDLIEIGVIGNIAIKEFQDFANDVKASIVDALEDPDMNWEPVKQLNPSFKILMDNARTITPDSTEVTAALELEDQTALSLMKTIKEKESTFMDKLMQEVQIADLDDYIKRFSDLGLVNSDYALLCNKTGQQLLRIPDTTALDDISQKGFRCFICGSLYSEEKLMRAVSCSDFGKKLLEDDYWFLVIALNSLHTLGIPYEECLIYTGESPDANIFLNINNEAVMLQLTNRKLSLDDAYLINAHIAAYKLNYMILVSTQPISALMKSHLKETNSGCSISFIESLSNLTNEINNIFIVKEKNRLEEILKSMGELTPIPIEKLMMKKLLPEGRTTPRTGLEDVLLTDFEGQSEEDVMSQHKARKNALITSIPEDLET